MTSTCTGACGFRSRKATARSERSTMSAGRSPATMRQKMQSAGAAVSLTESLCSAGRVGVGPGPLQLGVEVLEAPGGDAAGLDEPLHVPLLQPDHPTELVGGDHPLVDEAVEAAQGHTEML